jgi:predicted dehydrogenase
MNINNALLVGLGQIGLYYDYKSPNCIKTHARALSRHTHFKVTGIVDPNIENISAFHAQYGFVAAYCVIEAIPQDSYFDVIIIAVPTKFHLSVVTEIIAHFQYPPKLLLIEKPVGNNLAEFLEISEALSKHNIPFLVNYIRPYLPSWKNLPVREESNFFINHIFPPTLLNNGSHFLHLTHKLTKCDVLEIEVHNRLSDIDVCSFTLMSANTTATFNMIPSATNSTTLFYDNRLFHWYNNWSSFLYNETGSNTLKQEHRITDMYQSFIYDRMSLLLELEKIDFLQAVEEEARSNLFVHKLLKALLPNLI